VTMAVQELGITPVLNEQLKMCVTMLANKSKYEKPKQVYCQYQDWSF